MRLAVLFLNDSGLDFRNYSGLWLLEIVAIAEIVDNGAAKSLIEKVWRLEVFAWNIFNSSAVFVDFLDFLKFFHI